MTTLRKLLVGLGLVALTVPVGCGSKDATGTGGPGNEPTTTETSTTTTSAAPRPVADQTAPKSTFGLAFHDNKLWIADFYGGQVLAADPSTGEVLKRFKGDDGVSDEIDDVAIGPDGSVYWTGFNDGAIGRMSPANVSVVVAALPAGTNGIAFSQDGKLYVGRAVIGDGLWQIDPDAEKRETLIAPALGNVNAFAVGPDGFIYGPRYGTGGKGALVKIDPRVDEPTVGTVTELVAGFDGPIATKLSADGTKAFVLSLPPAGKPALDEVDLKTRKITPLTAPLTPLVDNLAVAPDGRIFVSAFNEPEVTVILPDGTAKRIGIGTKAPPEPTK